MSSFTEHTPVYLSWDDGNASVGIFRFDAVLNEGHDISSDVTEHPVEKGSSIADHVRPNPVNISIKGIVTDTPVGNQTDFERKSQVLQLYAEGQEAPKPKDPPNVLPPVATWQGPDPQFALPLNVRIGDGSGGFSQNASGGITTAAGFGGPKPDLGSLLSLNGITNFGLNALFSNSFTVRRAGDLQSKSGTFGVQQALDRNWLDNQNKSFLLDTPKGTQRYIESAINLLTALRDTATLILVIAPHIQYHNMVLRGVQIDRGPGAGGSAIISLSLKEIRLVSTSSVAAPKPSIVRANAAQDKGAQGVVHMIQKNQPINRVALGLPNKNPVIAVTVLTDPTNPTPYVPPTGFTEVK